MHAASSACGRPPSVTEHLNAITGGWCAYGPVSICVVQSHDCPRSKAPQARERNGRYRCCKSPKAEARALHINGRRHGSGNSGKVRRRSKVCSSQAAGTTDPSSETMKFITYLCRAQEPPELRLHVPTAHEGQRFLAPVPRFSA